MDEKDLGALGERIACEYLVKKGYNILERNYRITFGEIDIVARKKQKLFANNDKTIHFVEVKTIIALNDGFYPEDRVDYKKQRKLRQLANLWMEKHRFPQNHPYQIDVAGIIVNQESKKAKLHYFENAVGDIP